MTRPSLFGLLAFLSTTSCQTPVGPPAHTEVAELVTTAYAHPDKHLVSPQDAGSPDLIAWHRSYDGIDLLAEPKSVQLEGGRWVTRFIPELQEPPAVRRQDLVSLERAAQKLGVARELQDGGATARYVYQPVFIEKPNKAVVTNGFDVDRFIEKYVLVIEIVSQAHKTTTFLDAYSGVVLSSASHERSLIEVQGEVSAMTLNYGWVTLEMAGRQISTWGLRFDTYRDLERCTTMTATVPTKCKNGQGVASPDYLNLTQPITYDHFNPAANVRNDLYWGLEMSWDYFATSHGRRGLTNLAQSSFIWAPNDAIGRLSFVAGVTPSASMNVPSGVITLTLSGDVNLDKGVAGLDTIGHEWAHGVFGFEVMNYSNMDGHYWGEEGGLNESSSDLFGKLVEAFGLNRLGWQNDATIRTWTVSNRNMCTPSLDGHSFDEWFQGIDQPAADPHFTSGPVNRVHCLVARGLRAFGTSFAEPGLQSARVPAGFEGVGSDHLAKIWYRTLPKLGGYQRPVTFANARDAEILAAKELYGVYSLEQKAVEDAWAAVNMGPPADRTPPVITMLSTSPYSASGVLEASATDADGIKTVSFAIDGSQPIVLSAPPYRYYRVGQYDDGPHLLRVTATDLKNNSSTADFQIVVDGRAPVVSASDVTPCLTSAAPCPAFRMKRQFAVSATDYTGVNQVQLVVNGAVVDSFNGSSHVFEYTFAAAGVPDVRGRALDPFGQVGEGTVPYVYIDTAPPLISPGSGPLVSESTTVDGQLTWDFCARDTNGTVAFMYSQVWIDGVAVFTNRFPYYYDSCLRMVTAPIARGNHTWVLHVFDHWGNDATRTGTVSVVRMLPTMTMPIVTIDPIVVGRINISTAITAQYGLSKIAWRVEPVPAGQTIMVDTYPNSTSDLNKPYSQSVNGLVPGQTYYAAVVAIANNGQAQSRSSVYFTIPTGVTPAPPVVYTEVERNDVDRINGNIPPANLVPSNVAEIRGTYNADTLHPINGIAYTDSDVFRITVPVGKTLHVSSPFKCDDDPGASVAQVSIWRFSPTNPANSSLGVLAAVADAHGALSLNVTSQLSFGSDEMMIVVDYPFYLYGPCSNPAYVLNVSVN